MKLTQPTKINVDQARKLWLKTSRQIPIPQGATKWEHNHVHPDSLAAGSSEVVDLAYQIDQPGSPLDGMRFGICPKGTLFYSGGKL